MDAEVLVQEQAHCDLSSNHLRSTLKEQVLHAHCAGVSPGSSLPGSMIRKNQSTKNVDLTRRHPRSIDRGPASKHLESDSVHKSCRALSTQPHDMLHRPQHKHCHMPFGLMKQCECTPSAVLGVVFANRYKIGANNDSASDGSCQQGSILADGLDARLLKMIRA